MAAKIQFRRGLEADRSSVVPDAGEPLWASDTKGLHIGDGSTAGGKAVAMASAFGTFGWLLVANATAADARDELELGSGDSPTFAGLTTTGAATFGGLIRSTGDTGFSYGVLGSLGVSGITATHYTGDGTGYTWQVAYRTGGVTTAILSIDDAARYLSVKGSATGTAGAGEVRTGGGKINAAGDIETATGFRVAGSLQPVASVSLVNVNASSTYDLLTVGDNEMWQLDIGNATDGYMVHAVFGKPAASVGAVMAANYNTHANLTVALVGNVLRISNGVGATRTMIYTLTRLR